MDMQSRRVLILDIDRDVLITLQNVLADAEIDATITRDEADACQRLETGHYDLILIGDHPPDLAAAAILDDLSLRGTCPSALILRAIVSANNIEHFHRLGAIGTVSSRDSLAVLDEVKKALFRTLPKRAHKMSAIDRALSQRAS